MSDSGGYQVLARKYRPASFADLIGQDAMVRTLRAAFETDRIAQAFMLTGIRGTGKTSTARIIAKGLNCSAVDAPTIAPCGSCPQCRQIAVGTHVDVIEMDAASNTGVDNIRQNIIDTVSYAPSESRYKIYIIDEVHMLSTSAFNALLKTLEEPPAHVKFVFATTEIRKVPVTVLSRCQRFDLRRVEPEDMLALLRRIAEAEGAAIDDAALSLIARAAEGSVRDATSLLDQAIGQTSGETGAAEVRAMLGLADRGRALDLFDQIMRGDAAGALAEVSAQYADGADPAAILRELSEIAHWLSVMKVTPEAAEDPTLPPDIRTRGNDMAGRLSQRILGRAWQMLLTALEEAARAPNAMMATEMAIIRMTHVADLPPPEDLMRRLSEMPAAGTPAAGGPAAGGPAAGGPAVGTSPAGQPSAGGPVVTPHAQSTPPAPEAGHQPVTQTQPSGSQASGPQVGGPQVAAVRRAQPQPALDAYPAFKDVIQLIRDKRDPKLLIDVETGVHLVSYAPGRIAFRPSDDAPADLAQRLGARLQTWTGARWAVSVTSAEEGAQTLAEQRAAETAALEDRVRAHPLVSAVLSRLPGATIAGVRPQATTQDDAADAALPEAPEADDDWDPLDDTSS